MKSITPDEFFKQVAINSGVSDLDTVRSIFYGMVRTMSRELRDKHIVKLPDWGEFVLKIYKSRRARDVSDGAIRILPPKPMVKFVPDHKVKKYFYALGGDSTVV